MSRIASVLAGNRADLGSGPPVHALLIQNTNPVTVAPDSNRVRRGFLRDDLYTVVHEQFMTETAALADIVLPATTFLEHDDIYHAGGHSHVQLGRRLVTPPGECRSNHDVICALAARLGAEHPGFQMSAMELADATLRASGYEGADALIENRWVDRQPSFRASHFLDGFAHPDGRFRFAPNGQSSAPIAPPCPACPTTGTATTRPTPVTRSAWSPPPRASSSTPASPKPPPPLKREVRPTALLHPQDAADLGVEPGARLRLGNARGEVILHAAIAATASNPAPSSSKASGPTPRSRAASASTPSPARTQPSPTAAPSSTTRPSGSAPKPPPSPSPPSNP